MAGIEVGAKDRVLLGRRHGDPHVAADIGIAPPDPAHAWGWAKILGDDADRYAGPAAFTGRPISDRLATAETALGQDVVELARAFANKVGKDFPLLFAGEIRARRGRGEVELRGITRMLGHGELPVPARGRVSVTDKIARLRCGVKGHLPVN